MADAIVEQDAPSIGDNKPPLPDRLAVEYQPLLDQAEALAARANDAVKVITSDEEHEPIADLVKDVAAAMKKGETHRVAEKEPFLTAERQVDAFFGAPKTRLDRIKTELERRIKVFLDDKAARERKARDEQVRLQRQREDDARAEAKRIEDAAREAQQKAFEAEQKLRAEAAAADKEKAAELTRQANEQAAQRRRDELRANQDIAEAQQRELAERNAGVTAQKLADAKPADMARTRGSRSQSTLQRFWRAEIIDLDDVPLELLRPYLNRDEIQKAVDRAVATGVRKMHGVRIFEDSKAMVR